MKIELKIDIEAPYKAVKERKRKGTFSTTYL